MHHISDVDTWENPDRNYYIFVVLTILCGFIGLDHFYLRSFGTGTQKALTNIFTLGFWYWWDLIQVFTDGKKIRSEGLNSPLDWVQGIGRGVFTPLPNDITNIKGVQEGGATAASTCEKEGGMKPMFEAEKSYLVYAILAIFFGWLGADKFYMGEGWQGMAKLVSCFNIFLFLFGWLWVIWDAFHAFFMTNSILKDGISAPMPYSMVFSDTIDADVFKVKQIDPSAQTKKSSGNILDWIAKTFNFPSVPQGFSLRNVYREVLAPLMIPPVIKELKHINNPIIQPVSANIPLVTEGLNIGTSIPSLSPMSSMQQELPKMSGGGMASNDMSGGPGPVVAGALTAVVLAGGLKGFYDFIIKQYG